MAGFSLVFRPNFKCYLLTEIFMITNWKKPPHYCLIEQHILYFFVESTTLLFFLFVHLSAIIFFFPWEWELHENRDFAFSFISVVPITLLFSLWHHRRDRNNKICLPHVGKLEGIWYIYMGLNEKLLCLLCNYDRTHRIQILGITLSIKHV